MKLLSFYFLLIFSALLESCDRGNAESISQKPDPVTVTVVLCDLTKSIDTSAIYHISEHAVQINSLSKKGSQVFYYGIGPNDYQKVFIKNLPDEKQMKKELPEFI